ncbi:MAG: helix-hairpin-helix domain-containing protein [Bacteroidales bacterium]|nr:helix-hairpin-helix domain-containing protein [Bacteroidales bacterium]
MKNSSASFKVGAIALAFLIIGYQAALVVSRASRLRIEANRDRPDTVYIVSGELPIAHSETLRRNAPHSEYVQAYRRQTRRVESFRFNPNTVSVEDLIRLGFSEKQAQAIDNYRQKGGRFRRKSDFAKSFVVADSVYRRLEPYINIPRLDLNAADSAALDALPGIGPYYAARIVSYRAELGGYSYPEQLMDIYRFDREKYDGLKDLVFCSHPTPFGLWSLPADSLRWHPYIRSWQAARSIVLFRDNTPREDWTVEALGAAGILPEEDARRLARCVIAAP